MMRHMQIKKAQPLQGWDAQFSDSAASALQRWAKQRAMLIHLDPTDTAGELFPKVCLSCGRAFFRPEVFTHYRTLKLKDAG